jgi:hypothetical protein
MRALPTHYFVHTDKDDDGRELDISIEPTLAEAFGSIYNRKGRHKLKRREFRPHNRETRFRVHLASWPFSHDDSAQPFRLPEHPLDLPDWKGIRIDTDEFYGLGALFKREDGLTEVARLNRDALEEHGGDVAGEDWFLLIELGRKLRTLVYIDIHANGIGEESRSVNFPIRLVVPTADEVAKYT